MKLSISEQAKVISDTSINERSGLYLKINTNKHSAMVRISKTIKPVKLKIMYT